MNNNTEGANTEGNKNGENSEKKIKKVEIKIKKQIVNKDSSLDTNLFLLPEINDFKCIICENIPNPDNAYEVICCGLLFCKDCLFKWIYQTPNCPICKKELKNDPNYVRNIKENNLIFYKTLKKFIIKCPYECNWTGPWSEIENHLIECDKGYRECKYKDLGCEYIDEKNKIIEHEQKNDKLHLDLAMKFIKDNQRIDIPKSINNNNNNNNNSNNINNININNRANIINLGISSLLNRHIHNPFRTINNSILP